MAKVVRAKFTGPCSGVQRAFSTASKVVNEAGDQKVYYFHQLVHYTPLDTLNPYCLMKPYTGMQNKGYCIVSAHGEDTAKIDKAAILGMQIVDATCPKVKLVHNKIIDYSKRGYQVIIVGKKDHQEVLGSASNSLQEPIVVESIEELKNTKIDSKSFLTFQTTFDHELADEIIDWAKKNGLEIHNSICREVDMRIQSGVDLAKDGGIQVMIVLGDMNNSSNSKLLLSNVRSVTEKLGKETFSAMELNELKRKISTVNVEGKTFGLCAGASVPLEIINHVEEYLITL